jgi:hypothetical protein
MKKLSVAIIFLTMFFVAVNIIHTQHKQYERLNYEKNYQLNTIYNKIVMGEVKNAKNLAKSYGASVCFCITYSEAVMKFDKTGNMWRMIHGTWKRIPKKDWGIALRKDYFKVSNYNRKVIGQGGD